MNKRHLLGLVAVLTLLGLGIFYYKWAVLGFPLEGHSEAEVWTVEATVSFKAGAKPVKVDLRIPNRPRGFSILDENFVSKGYGLTTRYERSGRSAQWALRRPRNRAYTLYYRVTVYRDEPEEEDQKTPPYPPTPEEGEPYDTARVALVEEVRAQSADIETFTAEMLRRLNDPSPDQYIDLFLGRVSNATERAELAVNLLAGARIPARIIHGILLEGQQREADFDPWLEVHNGQRWLYFDPSSGKQGLPSNFLVWWRGTDSVVDVRGGGGVEVNMAVQPSVVDAMLVAEQRALQRNSQAVEYSLFSLPIKTQAVYSVLLLIPIGAFVVVLMRNLIGIKTYGTFMPVLMALAFRETRLVSGIVLFSLIVVLGLSIRFYLERLRLLLVPRLASVLIIVVLLMAAISVIGHKLGLETGLSVSLFPMVILTMVIERMSIVWEERGPGEALKEGAGSIVVAAAAFLVMSVDALQHVVFVFPELLLLLLAVTVLFGRYRGYRLFELFRFKEFLKEG